MMIFNLCVQWILRKYDMIKKNIFSPYVILYVYIVATGPLFSIICDFNYVLHNTSNINKDTKDFPSNWKYLEYEFQNC